MQAFAAQGYVVAGVQYHGSTSFGHAFKASISSEWGKREALDIEAATDYLIKQGYIDPERLVATGGSYGGYMVGMLNGRAHLKLNKRIATKPMYATPAVSIGSVCLVMMPIIGIGAN